MVISHPLTQIYNEKEQADQGQIQHVQFREKKSTRKWNVEDRKSSTQGDKKFKEKPVAKLEQRQW